MSLVRVVSLPAVVYIPYAMVSARAQRTVHMGVYAHLIGLEVSVKRRRALHAGQIKYAVVSIPLRVYVARDTRPQLEIQVPVCRKTVGHWHTRHPSDYP